MANRFSKASFPAQAAGPISGSAHSARSNSRRGTIASLSARRRQRAVLNAAGGLAVASLVVDWLINPLYFRSRPFVDHAVSLLFYEPTDSSFPANPATVAFAVATGVWLWNRRVGAALYGLAVLYALSRVYGGVFYPLDVVGGAAIGIAASLLVNVVIRRFAVLPTLAIRLARAVYLG